MIKFKKSLLRFAPIYLLGVAVLDLVVMPIEVQANDFETCGRVSSDVARLACFDALSSGDEATLAGALGDRAGDWRLCASIGSNAARLACFTPLTGGTVAASPIPSPAPLRTVSPQPVPRPVPPPAPAMPAEEAFGNEYVPSEKTPESGSEVSGKNLVVMVVRTKKDRHGFHSFYLANGQVWRQTSARRFNIPKYDYQVRVSKKRFSGYRLVVEQEKISFDVKRIH